MSQISDSMSFTCVSFMCHVCAVPDSWLLTPGSHWRPWAAPGSQGSNPRAAGRWGREGRRSRGGSGAGPPAPQPGAALAVATAQRPVPLAPARTSVQPVTARCLPSHSPSSPWQMSVLVAPPRMNSGFPTISWKSEMIIQVRPAKGRLRSLSFLGAEGCFLVLDFLSWGGGMRR